MRTAAVNGVAREATTPRPPRLAHLGKQQRGPWLAVRRAHMAINGHTAVHDPSVHARPNEPNHAGVINASLEPVDHDVVVDSAKELGETQIHRHALARRQDSQCGTDRIVDTPSSAKTVAESAEGGINLRSSHLRWCCRWFGARPSPAIHLLERPLKREVGCLRCRAIVRSKSFSVG